MGKLKISRIQKIELIVLLLTSFLLYKIDFSIDQVRGTLILHNLSDNDSVCISFLLNKIKIPMRYQTNETTQQPVFLFCFDLADLNLLSKNSLCLS